MMIGHLYLLSFRRVALVFYRTGALRHKPHSIFFWSRRFDYLHCPIKPILYYIYKLIIWPHTWARSRVFKSQSRYWPVKLFQPMAAKGSGVKCVRLKGQGTGIRIDVALWGKEKRKMSSRRDGAKISCSSLYNTNKKIMKLLFVLVSLDYAISWISF